MPEVRASLTLEADDALSTVESVGEGLTSALDEAISAFTSSFDAALSEAASSVSSLGDTPIEPTVTADVSEAAGQIDSLDATPIDVPVEADTSAAQESIDALESSAVEAGGGLDELSGAASGFSAASDLATGGAAGLGSAISEIAPEAAGAVGAIAAVAATIGVVFNQALDAQGATERFNATFGDLAGSVNKINVGSLNTDLSTLALTLGSDDDALRQAAATMFQFATNAGVGEREAARFSEKVIALAANAVAANPALGDVADVVPLLSRGLATGGRFAQRFGIDLTASAIAARAMQDRLPGVTGELSVTEKQMAGAALATEKLGSALGGNVDNAAKNSIITFARLKQTLQENLEALGAPIVAPVFELMEALIPVATEVARILVSLAASVLPSITSALAAVTPALSVLAGVLELMPDFLIGATGGAVLLGKAFGTAGAVVGALLPILNQIDPALGQVATTAAIGFSVGGPWGAAVGAVVGLGTALLSSGKSAAETRAEIKKLAGEIKGLGAEAAARTFLGTEASLLALSVASRQAKGDVGAFGVTLSTIVGAAFSDARRDIRLLAQESPGAAANVVAGLRSIGDASEFTKAQLDLLEQIVARQTGTFQENAVAGEKISATDQALADAATLATAQMEALTSSINTTIPTATGTFQTFASSVQSAFGIATPSVQSFVDNLASTVQGVATWLTNVRSLLTQNLPGLAQLVQSQGAEIGGALAIEIQNATPKTRLAWETAIQQGTFALTTGKTEADALSKETAAAILTNFGTVPPGTADTLGQVPGVFAAAAPATEGAAGALATGTVDAFGAPLPGGFSQGIASGIQIAQGVFGGPVQFGMNATAYTSGQQVGDNFARGIAAGIRVTTPFIEEAAREAVRAAKVAADNAGSPSEHLFFDSGSSFMAAMAAGVSSTGRDVVATAEQIVRDAANTGIAGMSTGSSSSAGGSGGPVIDRMNVTVTGNVDNTATGLAVGDAIGVGVQARLSPTRARAIRARVRTRG